MCGIFGFADLSRKLPAETDALLNGMADSLRHRGPDGRGFHRARHAALGMTRLGIMDPEGEGESVRNEDGSVWVVHNGEIYNAAELRARLEKKGHVFRTGGDSEVIPHLYEEEGEGFAASLRGMFAVALWDEKKRRLLLIRDRFGEKPLFYSRIGSRLVFASEMKAILVHPGVDRSLDPAALDHYFAHMCTLNGETIYRGVHKLPPAHRLLLNAASFQLRRYWNLPPDPEEDKRDPRRIVSELHGKIEEAVGLQLASDVPVGAFLSGGIDTAVIASVVSGFRKRSPTFQLSFRGASYDESPEARCLSRFFGTAHHSSSMPDVSPTLLEKIAWHFDEPFADTSALPMYFVSKLARSKVKVALGGDGGDELFGGYSHYRNASGRSRPPTALFGEKERLFLYSDDYYAPFEKKGFPSLEAGLSSGSVPKDPLRKLLWLDMHLFLPNDMLTKVDRMAMAWGLETRSPFLDHCLAEFVWRLPSRWKVRGRSLKHGLKSAFRGMLPAWCLQKEKKGFVFEPGLLARKGRLKEYVDDVLSPARIRRAGILRPQFVEYIRLSYARAFQDRSPALRATELRLWSLIFFEIWRTREAKSGNIIR